MKRTPPNDSGRNTTDNSAVVAAAVQRTHIEWALGKIEEECLRRLQNGSTGRLVAEIFHDGGSIVRFRLEPSELWNMKDEMADPDAVAKVLASQDPRTAGRPWEGLPAEVQERYRKRATGVH